MKHYLALSAVLLVVGCTKKEVVTQTENGAETNMVLVPKRGASAPQDTTNNLNGPTTGVLETPAGAENSAAGKAAQSAAGQQSGNPADDALAQRVRVAISTGSTGTTGLIANTDLTPLEVEAKDGVVTIRGTVESEKEMQSVIEQVRGLQGVTKLKTELQVGKVENRPGRTTTVQGNADETLPSQQQDAKLPDATPRATE